MPQTTASGCWLIQGEISWQDLFAKFPPMGDVLAHAQTFLWAGQCNHARTDLRVYNTEEVQT